MSIRGNDYDGTSYEFTISEEGNKFEASYYFEAYKSIINIIGKDFFAKKFPDFTVEFNTASKVEKSDMIYDFTLYFSAKGFDKKTRKKMINEKATILARVKATFFAAPYETVLKTSGDLNKQPVSFNIRDDENVWVVPIGKPLKKRIPWRF